MFDIAVNLTSSQFKADFADVVERAYQVGVNGMLLLGTSVQESIQAQQMAATLAKGCWATAGVHPHSAKEWSEQAAETLFQLAQQERVVAIGECGLDFNRNYSSLEAQERAFCGQLALAAELQMPLYIHCREAQPRLVELLKPWLEKLPNIVVHCFTGSGQELKELLSLGCFIGITGWICDERRGQELCRLLPLIPIERLLFESDAPYLLPRNLRPRPATRRNEPSYLPHIISEAAGYRLEDALWLGQQAELNAQTFFRVSSS